MYVSHTIVCIMYVCCMCVMCVSGGALTDLHEFTDYCRLHTDVCETRIHLKCCVYVCMSACVCVGERRVSCLCVSGGALTEGSQTG